MSSNANMGKTKRSTDDLINDAIAQQNDWLENRREYTRGFLNKLNLFACKRDGTRPEKKDKKTTEKNTKSQYSVLRTYWFPVLCAFVVIFVAIWVAFIRGATPSRITIVPNIPEPVIKPVRKINVPEFDIVRIDKSGNVVIAGRWMPNQNVSIMSNGKIVATQRTDNRGEFVYTSSHAWNAGNYTIALLGDEPEVKSADKVFVYVSDQGADNSVSLLMTKDGSTLLQMPTILHDGDLDVRKIDYLSNGRIVVTGDAMPRLRVSLTLNGQYLGFARVSDYKHFGLGADVGELQSGQDYELVVRLHDGDGRTIANVTHNFVMPEMTGDDDTYYTVRRGDCLWIIARNFLRRGILFSIIAERNNIKNPDLIYPEQKLNIPLDSMK